MIKMAALVALLGLSGCSFIGVRSEPTRPWLSDGPTECNGYGLPVLDTVGAVITLGVGTVTTFIASRGQTFGDSPNTGRNAVVVVSVTALAIGLGYALSAARGYHRVAACRSAIDERAR